MTTESSTLNDTSKKQTYSLADRLRHIGNVIVTCLIVAWRDWWGVCASIGRGLFSTIPPDDLKTHEQARWYDMPLGGLVIALLALLLNPFVYWVGGVTLALAYVDAAATTVIVISVTVLGIRGYRLRKKDNDGSAGEDGG